MTTTSVKLVIFDCDGTLVDSQHAIVAAMSDAFLSEGLAPPPREEVVGVVGLSLGIAVARLVPDGSDLARVDRLAEAYKAAFAAQGRRADHAEPLYDGIRDTLQRLAAREDVVLGIATGKSRRGVASVLEREGLAGLFATIQTADTHPSKPHPSMVLTAMDETAALPVDTVVIGDTTYDIEMARGAGAAAVGVAWGYHPEEALRAAGAHHVSPDTGDLERALDLIMARRLTA
ncbi:HAD-IA family hydrolase [Hyphomicrobium sp.]|uniref:HAD-IA family hydrolase n=1 Tax=Hyphomicrobium sp. TaxID=82 RepID=UPI0025C1DB8C|nr:HAD-IA family hydrolase [Hyphomicrobium sp.]MCC7251848.1 HAD-IA family hydrolase [Hyphomicrobium sp.]